MIDAAFAHRFAQAWVAAWNAHNLDEILSHYDEDFEMYSPVIAQLHLDPSGHLRGRSTVKSYWTRALQRVPDLQFELMSVLVGSQSVTLYYKGARDRISAEVFFFNAQGKVTKALAHYAS
jgi:SnoaL-like domain